jgi:hypothetical protein
MKTTFKQLAAGTFIALLFLAGNVKAGETEVKASGQEMTETLLQLENWMIDETIWEINSFYTSDFAEETETELELESWMTSESMWDINMHFTTEAETELELESWMTNEEIWNVEETTMEEKLMLENWMVDPEFWK